MPERFGRLNHHANQYLLRHNKKLQGRRITEVTMGLSHCKNVHKARGKSAQIPLSCSRPFIGFCDQHSQLAARHEVLRWTYTGVANVNMSVRTLDRGGHWLDEHHGQTAFICGVSFLKTYTQH